MHASPSNVNKLSEALDRSDYTVRLDNAIIGLEAATALLSFAVHSGRAGVGIESAFTRLRLSEARFAAAKADIMEQFVELNSGRQIGAGI